MERILDTIKPSTLRHNTSDAASDEEPTQRLLDYGSPIEMASSTTLTM